MNYLLDSHVFLWALLQPEKLSEKVRLILENSNNNIFVSAVTFWEISMKFDRNKLDLNGISPTDLPALAEQTGFELLPLMTPEAANYHQLQASWHRDPFDRMLICQAIASHFTLLSKDEHVAKYRSVGLKVTW